MITPFDWVVVVLLGVGAAEGFLWLAATRMRPDEEEAPDFAVFLGMKLFCLVGGAVVAGLFAALMEGSDRLMPAVPASLGALGAAIVIGLVLALNWRLWQNGLSRPRPSENDEEDGM